MAANDNFSTDCGLRGTWRSNEAMRRHSSWRCGGPAAFYFEPADREDAAQFLANANVAEFSDRLWIGLGSNLLVRDGGIAATVVATNPGLSAMRWDSAACVYVECGVPCARLAREAARHGRDGLAFLAGIPGAVGGALRMNAGAHGCEMWDYVKAVEVFLSDGRIQTCQASEFQPTYRAVGMPPDCDFEAFLGAWLHLPTVASGDAAEAIKQVLATRARTQPTGKATCGSVFRNPPGDFAGRLLEQCGLKGQRIGDACISEVHANFIENHGAATAADIESLIKLAQRRVREQTGVELQPEVQIVGQAVTKQGAAQ